MATRRPSVPAMTALGKALFFDPALSASGKQSCASCHSPTHAYGPPNDLSVQLGGADMRKTGVRAAPSLRYVQNVPAFTEHFYENDGNDSEDQGPTGGYTWDGRVSSTHDQARIPLLSAHEMANGTQAAVVAKVRNGRHAQVFRQVFGNDILDNEDTAFRAALMVLEVFQQTPSEFYPYDSKYDAFLRKQVKLSPQEMRGLQVFADPAKGNCASCHVSAIKQDGAFPAFTDFGHIAVGVPRNRTLAANADPKFFDLGLCGPDRTDLKDRADYCGRFRTPSLRNVALRKTFFHNGAIHSLEDAVRFYAQRDTLAKLSSDAFRKQFSEVELTSIDKIVYLSQYQAQALFTMRVSPVSGGPMHGQVQGIAQLLFQRGQIMVCSYVLRTGGSY